MDSWKDKKLKSKQDIFVNALVEKYDITVEEAESVVHGIDKWVWYERKDKKNNA